MENTIQKMETLTCPTCALKIEKALGKTQGVKSATVRFNSSSAEVRFDETITDIQKLKETVQKLGYEVLE